MDACVNDMIQVVNAIAPFRLAEKWDNSGLQAGDPGWPVRRILVALDVSMAALAYAEKQGCDLILSHHPLLISAEKQFDFSQMPGSAICFSARKKVAVLSAHTNLDKAANGLNDYFARKIGILCEAPFCPDGEDDPTSGLGRIGRPERPVTVRQLVDRIKEKLGLNQVRVAGSLDLKVRKAAVCTGSGGSLVSQFLATTAQVYITGDLKYHEARDVEVQGRAVIDVGHFASEHMVVDLLCERLQQELPRAGYDAEVLAFTREKDPFNTI